MRSAIAITLALSLPSISLSRAPQWDTESLRLPQASSFEQCSQLFAQGKPPAIAPQAQYKPLCYDTFAILHSANTKTPVYVAQRLNRKALEDASRQKRSNRFFADARLRARERAELDDYRNSGYSRGHMAPAADMATPNAMAQSFSLANMVPQDVKHNGGPWSRIEQDTRKYIRRAKGDVYVITGPVFTDAGPRIGKNGVKVPSYLFKLVYDPSTRNAWAHWQANSPTEKISRPISYEELVKRTGIEFLPGALLDD